MAFLPDAGVKETSGAGGYDRWFGIPALGGLISRIRSAVISLGKELEQMIPERGRQIENLDEFLKPEIMPGGVLIATKRQVEPCESIDCPGSGPDFVIFKRRDGRQNCYVAELKDGRPFDTKKAGAERWQAIHSFIGRSSPRLQYRVSAHFCCCNQEDRKAIIVGSRGKITPREAMTG